MVIEWLFEYKNKNINIKLYWEFDSTVVQYKYYSYSLTENNQYSLIYFSFAAESFSHFQPAAHCVLQVFVNAQHLLCLSTLVLHRALSISVSLQYGNNSLLMKREKEMQHGRSPAIRNWWTATSFRLNEMQAACIMLCVATVTRLWCRVKMWLKDWR